MADARRRHGRPRLSDAHVPGQRAGAPISDGGVVTVVAGCFEALVGRGLAGILGEDTRVRILASDLESAALKHAVTDLAPQVAILDEVSLRSMSRDVRAMQSATGVLVFAREPTITYGLVLLSAGVSCVAGNASAGDILASVQITGQGGCVFVSGDGGRVERPDREKGKILTERESQVLEGLSKGKPYGEIAPDLKISPATVKKHTTSLLGKLGASSKRELVGMPILGNEPNCGPPSRG
jgi:DNA-binding NarL/FixJ family response regulator